MIWRLGTVPYLNADPLTAALREDDAALLVGDPVEISGLVPSLLLESLLAGELDAALVSVGGVLPYRNLRLLPGMGVVSDGPVRSIVLYCRKPVQRIQRVALDSSSRSAVALARVLFAERWRVQPEFITLPPNLPTMLDEADAALLIGNPALVTNQQLDGGDLREILLEDRLDLGEEWRQMTGLPFVYAAWAIPTGVRLGRGNPGGWERDQERLTRLLHRAKSWGTRRLGMLARRGAVSLGLPLEVAAEYLNHAIRYDVGEREEAGIRLFCELAVRHNILPASSALRMADVSLTAR